MTPDTSVGTISAIPKKTPKVWDSCNLGGAAVPYIGKINNNPPVANFIDDVVQGPIANCYLLAAIAAYAWIFYKDFLIPANSTPFPGSIAMHVPIDGVLQVPNNKKGMILTDQLPLTHSPSSDTCGAPLTVPLFAGCIGNESWVALYEKAYAIAQQLCEFIPPNTCNPCPVLWGPYNPNIFQLGGGNPLYALQTISGLNFSYCGNPTTAFYTQSWKASNGTKYIGMNDPENPTWGSFSAVFDPVTGKTLHPTVAWTFFSENGNGDLDRPIPQSVIKYNTDWMVANHAYTVLGKWSLPDPNQQGKTEEYMILRNPFGPSWSGNPSLPVYDAAGKFVTDAVFQKDQNGYGFPWKWDINANTNPKKLNIGQVSCNPTTNRAKPDGIFALRKQEFLKYFEVAGWVQ